MLALKKNRCLVLFPISLVLYEFSVYMANDMIMPGMLQVTADFHASPSVVPMTLAAYLLGGSSLQIFIGPLSDRIGRRKVMLAGVLFFILCTFFIAFSFSMPAFLWGRFLQGAGLCFIAAIGYAAVQEFYEEQKAIRLVAIMTVASLLAPLLGPLVGGVFMEYFSWRFIFLFIGILSALSFVGLWLFMPETAHFQYSPDKSFVKHLNAAVIPKHNVTSIAKLYGLLFQNIPFLCGSLGYGLLVAPLLCWISVSPLVLTTTYHVTGTAFGVSQVPLFGTLMFANFALNQLAKRFSSAELTRMGLLWSLAGAGCAVLFTYGFKPQLFNLIASLSIYCIGIGLLGAPLNRQLLFATAVPKGTVSSLLSLLINAVLIATTAIMPMVYRNGNDKHFALFIAGCVCTGSLACVIFLRAARPAQNAI